MKRMTCIIATCSIVAAGCSNAATDDGEELGAVGEDLNGVIIPSGANLTRRTFSDTSEAARQSDTTAYYKQVRIGADGVSGPTIAAGLSTLNAFIANYQFAANDVRAFYYNRGDLG